MSVLRETAASLSACIIMFVTGAWLAWPSPALKNLYAEGQAPVHLTESEGSWAVALLDVGNMVSPIPTGYIVDSIGRKNVLLASGPMYLASWLMTLVPGTPYLIYLARFMCGICKGITFTVVPLYLGEIASVRIRGALSTLCTGFLWGGSLFMLIVGPMVSYEALSISAAVFPVLFFATFLWMPESPYGCLMRKKYDEARRSLAWLRTAGDAEIDAELAAMRQSVEEDMQTMGSYADLVRIGSNRKAMKIVMASSAYQRLCGISAILAFSSTTLPPTSGLSFLEASQIIVVFGFVLTVGNFIATPLVDSLGRKPLLLLSGAGLALSTAVSGCYYLLSHEASKAWIPYASLIAFGVFHAIGLGVIPSTLLSEMFPANVKSRAAAVSSIVFALGSFVTNKLYTPVKLGVGVWAMYFFFCFNAVTYSIFAVFYLFETKGRTFTEIQERLKRKRTTFNTKVQYTK